MENLMSPGLGSLGIDLLSVPERLTLVHAIWDSIAADRAAVPLSDSQLAEIRRRAARHDAGQTVIVPWEEVESEAPAKLQR
jgi:putative addiction module component (TIGR02574 family)